MQLWQFAAAVAVSYLGLLAGFFLASATKEELPTARKYFPWLQRLVIIAIAAVVMDSFNFNTGLKVAAYALLLAVIAVGLNLQFFYAAFGVLLFVVSKNQNTLLIVSSMVFLFGLLTGSIHFDSKVKKKSPVLGEVEKLLISNASYLVVAVVLFLVLNYV
ncbi:hypothetical protein HYV83_03870 [Candidatus Woesearchaeota archaeon]|nr:hypothetical protein [Candidatus Woesearchaeota archaeon]